MGMGKLLNGTQKGRTIDFLRREAGDELNCSAKKQKETIRWGFRIWNVELRISNQEEALFVKVRRTGVGGWDADERGWTLRFLF
jgi:hypothetical protein